jgi:hypothetical protein
MICIHVYVCICMHYDIYMRIYLYVYVCIYDMYIRIYLFMYTYIYSCTYTVERRSSTVSVLGYIYIHVFIPLKGVP